MNEDIMLQIIAAFTTDILEGEFVSYQNFAVAGLYFVFAQIDRITFELMLSH